MADYTEADGKRVFESVRVDTDPPIVFRNPFRAFGADDEDEVARMELLAGFHRSVIEGGEPAYGPRNARKDLELCYAIRESARLGNVWLDLTSEGAYRARGQAGAGVRRRCTATRPRTPKAWPECASRGQVYAGGWPA